MRSGRGIAAAALGCALLAPARGLAQDARLQAVFSGSLGYTDNVFNTPEGVPDDDPNAKEPAVFTALSPGLVFGYLTPRTSNTLTYTLATSFYFQQSGGNTITNTLTWSGRFATSPTTTLTLGATGTQGQLSALARTTTAGTTPLEEIPTEGATTYYLQGGVNEGFSKQLSPVLSISQAVNFLVYEPFEDPPPRTYNVTNTLGVQRLWQHDTGALALSTGYTHFDNIEESEDTFVSRDQLVNTLVASWQREYGHYFSSQVDAGVTQAMDLGGGNGQLWNPAGLAALRYTRTEAQAEVSYTHAAQLNVFLSQIVLIDQIALRLSAPISHAAHLSAEGSAGVLIGRPIENGNLGDPTTSLLADAALLWSPITPVPELALSLRYQRIHQLGTAATDDAELVRNTFLFSVSAAFPAARETSTRILITQPFGSAGPQGGAPRRPQPAPEETTEPAASAPPAAAGAP